MAAKLSQTPRRGNITAHFPAKAKRVIFLFMQGGPSHVDTWDYKPALERWNEALGRVDLKAPIVIRLDGTNAEAKVYTMQGVVDAICDWQAQVRNAAHE